MGVNMAELADLILDDYCGGACEVLSATPSLARLRLTPEGDGMDPVEFEVSPYRVLRRGADEVRENPAYLGDPSYDHELDLVWLALCDGAWDEARPCVVSPVPSAIISLALRSA